MPLFASRWAIKRFLLLLPFPSFVLLLLCSIIACAPRRLFLILALALCGRLLAFIRLCNPNHDR